MSIKSTSPLPRLVEHLSSLVLFLAALLAVVVSLQSLFVTGLHERGWWPSWAGEEAWASGSTAVTFLVGILTLLAVRAQLRLGIRPVLTWSRVEVGARESVLGKDAKAISVLRLRNNGLGPLVFAKVRYQIGGPGEAAPTRSWAPRAAHDHKAMTAALRAVGLTPGVDLLVPKFSRYGTVGADQEVLLAELPDEVWASIGSVAIWVSYRGVLGSTYRSLITAGPPDRVAPTLPPSAPPAPDPGAEQQPTEVTPESSAKG